MYFCLIKRTLKLTICHWFFDYFLEINHLISQTNIPKINKGTPMYHDKVIPVPKLPQVTGFAVLLTTYPEMKNITPNTIRTMAVVFTAFIVT